MYLFRLVCMYEESEGRDENIYIRLVGGWVGSFSHQVRYPLTKSDILCLPPVSSTKPGIFLLPPSRVSSHQITYSFPFTRWMVWQRIVRVG